MPALALTRAQIAAIATLHAAIPDTKHARDTTPVLTNILVSTNGDTLTATATDRYIVATMTFPVNADSDAILMLPSTDWQTIAKAKTDAAITWETNTVTVNYADGRGQTFIQGEDNYPAVSRLFADTHKDVPENTKLNLAHLARLSKITPPSVALTSPAKRDNVWSIAQNDSATAHAPVTLTYSAAADETLRALTVSVR